MISKEAFQRICRQMEVIIDRVRAANHWAANGALELPFYCYLCERRRCDFHMMTGDKLPICCECFEGLAGKLGG